MSRRVRSLITGGVLFVVLVALAVTLPVPYVILGPGPTLNTLTGYEGAPIISLTGRQAKPTQGHLNLTTVSVSTSRITVLQALTGWLAGDRVVVPRETIYPPGQTTQQIDQQNATDFTDSQNSAEAAAFCELGYPKGFGIIATTTALSPAGALRSGDRLVSVGGTRVANNTQLEAVLNRHRAGDKVPVAVVRLGRPVTPTVTLAVPAPGRKTPRIGIEIGTTCFATYSVKIGLNDAIGGPSAGMMFALGIIDKVGSDNLTGGRFIAGTGTIDNAGQVGPIGGIQLKMIAARRAGAAVFLAPAGNCTEVRGHVPAGLSVAKVSTLHEAVQALDAVRAGHPVTGC